MRRKHTKATDIVLKRGRYAGRVAHLVLEVSKAMIVTDWRPFSSMIKVTWLGPRTEYPRGVR